jgi:hypothetical protein
VERVIPFDEDNPETEMRVSIKIPDVGGEPEAALKRLVRELFYTGQEPEEYAGGLLVFFRQQYEGIKELVRRDPDYPMSSLNWFYDENFETPLVSPSLIVLKRKVDFYTGGAHGMNIVRWYVIDRAKAEQVRIDSLFSGESGGELQLALEAALRIKAGAGVRERLSSIGYFEDSVPVPENFFLGPEGVGFHWDPYEIAPYSFGPVEVILPYGEIRSLFSSRGRDLIASF